LCQVDHVYLRTAKRYERVLQQRNALLREARERPVRADQFTYWDTQLIELGTAMVVARLRALHRLNQLMAHIYPRLATDAGGLTIAYRSSVPLDGEAMALFREEMGDLTAGAPAAAVTRLHEVFTAQLAAIRGRERQQAVTLVGPHRDDAVFHAGEVDLRVFGSRGQQRAAALSLKLAEVELMQQYTAERPVLLLDDVMSELDPHRRRFLQRVLQEQEQQQVLLTATDLAFFDEDFRRHTDVYQVEAGTIRCTQRA
jgi:DNA replication and repair protein RecF